MPAPDGREWIQPSTMATRLGQALIADERLPEQLRMYLIEHRTMALEILRDTFGAAGFKHELTLLRLVEKIKDAIARLAFGPLYIPNTVDVEGLPIPTPVGQIYEALRDCYDWDFLDLFDEDGNLLPPNGGGS